MHRVRRRRSPDPAPTIPPPSQRTRRASPPPAAAASARPPARRSPAASLPGRASASPVVVYSASSPVCVKSARGAPGASSRSRVSTGAFRKSPPCVSIHACRLSAWMMIWSPSGHAPPPPRKRRQALRLGVPPDHRARIGIQRHHRAVQARDQLAARSEANPADRRLVKLDGLERISRARIQQHDLRPRPAHRRSRVKLPRHRQQVPRDRRVKRR